MVAGVSVAGFYFIRGWRSHRFVARAEAFLSAGDLHSAALVDQSALALDRENVAALRVMARIAEKGEQKGAIDWWERVVARLPNSTSDLIALAKAALTFNELGVADSALTRARNTGAKNPEYHEAMAQLAIAKKNPKAAEAEYEQAVALDPSEKNHQLNLAVFRLQSPDPDVRLKSSKFLQGLMNENSVRAAAARALLDYAIQRRDPAALEIASLLVTYPEASFRERLRCAQIFRDLDLDQYSAALTKLEEEAQADPQKTTDLLSWLAGSHQSTLALDWAKRIPEAMLKRQPVFVALADCYIAAGDCGNLEKWCRGSDWQNLEFLRHAYLAYALRECNKKLDSDLEWTKAVQRISNPEELYALQQDAAKWGWTEQAIELLWRLSKDPTKAKTALNALYQHYAGNSDTRNLYLVASRSAQIAPNDPYAQNNFAQLASLLKVDLDNALTVAQRVYERDPQNPNFASTYAFALFSNDRTRQALKVMNTLPQEQLSKPEIAAYYGIILAASNDAENAREFLEIGSKAKLLPEEKELIEKALTEK